MEIGDILRPTFVQTLNPTRERIGYNKGKRAVEMFSYRPGELGLVHPKFLSSYFESAGKIRPNEDFPVVFYDLKNSMIMCDFFEGLEMRTEHYLNPGYSAGLFRRGELKILDEEKVANDPSFNGQYRWLKSFQTLMERHFKMIPIEHVASYIDPKECERLDAEEQKELEDQHREAQNWSILGNQIVGHEDLR